VPLRFFAGEDGGMLEALESKVVGFQKFEKFLL
jgi:hypothetical protein